MRAVIFVSFAVLARVATLAGQEALSAQQLFEAGQYEPALQAIGAQREAGTAGSAEAYLAGQVLVRLDQADRARQEFANLTRAGDPVWTLIGESAIALLDNNRDSALATAQKAASDAPTSFHAQYQLGLAKARFEDWAGCAEAFGKAAELNPNFAYAHYYAGLSYSRIKRADRTSEYFERFLKLAPRAPERAAIESLMRTLRGV